MPENTPEKPKLIVPQLSAATQTIIGAIVGWIVWYMAKPYLEPYFPPELVKLLDVGIPAAGLLAATILIGRMRNAIEETNVETKQQTEKIDQVTQKVEAQAAASEEARAPGGAVDTLVRDAIKEVKGK